MSKLELFKKVCLYLDVDKSSKEASRRLIDLLWIAYQMGLKEQIDEKLEEMR